MIEYNIESYILLKFFSSPSPSPPHPTLSPSQHQCSRSRNEELRKRYRFLREDFGPLKTIALHSDLIFDFTPERVHVTNSTTFAHADDTPLSTLSLDANKLEIGTVEYLSGNELSILPTDFEKSKSKKAHWSQHVSNLRTIPTSKYTPCKFNYDETNQKLNITLPKALNNGESFIIRMTTICRPNASMLEGLYLDYTPKGCPQTVITQCQQYGFQRITPSVDQMLNKQTYTTTIIADGAFTNLITNGDLSPEFSKKDINNPTVDIPNYSKPHPLYPACFPTPTDIPEDLANRRVMVTYENLAVPMATYLFFLGVGTYVTYSRTVEYPDGDVFRVELLLFPGLVPYKAAVEKLDIIVDSVLWTHVSLGPEALLHENERTEMYTLLQEREKIVKKLSPVYSAVISTADPELDLSKINSDISIVPTEAELNPEMAAAENLSSEEKKVLDDRLSVIRQRTAQLIKAWNKPGYKYTGQVYREISMENSQYGGMENVGNTTIVSAVIAVTPNTTDKEAVYIEGVTIHEYFHNQNGSEVTGASPFEIWLNEAVTVWFERRKVAERFGADFRRLEIVKYAFMPGSGPLAMDSSPNSMAVEPEGFNATTELISAMTYSKAPEIVNMIMMLMGEEKFHRALDLYYTRYAHSNATTEQWLNCMEEIAGRSFALCAKGWLTRTGHPVLHYSTKVEENNGSNNGDKPIKVTLSLHQKGFQEKPSEEQYPWNFPVSYSLVKDGAVIYEDIYEMDQEKAEIEIFVNEKPDFASMARNWSFFGRIVNDDATTNPQSIAKQALSDPDVVNKRFAFLSIADIERFRVLAALQTDANIRADAAGKKNKRVELPQVVLDVASDVVDTIENRGLEKFNVASSFVKLYASILFDDNLSPGTRASILALGESSSINGANHLYWQLSDVTTAMYQAICYRHNRQLVDLYSTLDNDQYYTGQLQTSMHVRSLKQLVLSILLSGMKYAPLLEHPSIHLAPFDFVHFGKRLIFTSPFMSDRMMGLSLILSLPDGVAADHKLTYLGNYTPKCTYVSAPLISPLEKTQIIEKARREFAKHPDSWSTYIAVVSAADSDDVFDIVTKLASSPDFRMELAGHARTLCRSWVVHRKRALLTQEGLDKTAEICVKVGKVNEMSAYAILQSFSDISSFTGDAKAAMIECLKDMQKELDSKAQQSLYNNIARILDVATKEKNDTNEA